MGGVDDDEPALKRLKLGSGKLTVLSNGSSLTEPIVGSFRDLMARPLQSEGDKEVIGLKGVIKKVEFVRIIAEALYSLGYKKSYAHLEEESGIPLHSSAVDIFTQQILDGSWDESVATLHNIGLEDESIVKSATFLILEQKFFELLDGDKTMEALKTLRTEITPLSIHYSRVQELSSCIVSPTHCDSVGSSNQGYGRTKSRTKLLEEVQKVLPPEVIIPENRLEHLVEQVLTLQRDACIYHNSLDKEMSLYSDHHCGKDLIPSRTLQIDVNGGVSLKHRLSGHQKPVSSVSWSPDDHQLLTCGVEEVVRRWDVSSGECLQVYEKVGLGLVSCGWFPDGKWIFSGISDKSICMWELNGKEVECCKGQRTLKISDLEITSDGKQIISKCRENALLLLDKEAKIERVIEENQTITSFSLSRDNRFLLVSLLDQEIHLWSIDGDARLVAMYKGHKRSRFVIRSCFGGHEEAFIASGSEDSQLRSPVDHSHRIAHTVVSFKFVYLWHRRSGELVEALSGHSGAVNCVSWNPANPHMLASASDDHTIRIWGVNALHLKHKSAHCNGIHYCNGGT
ncbi:hypothetical protein DKX38_008321 [Salix brachista]|uniref:CTLH domain-containing protein n=1 Tax=Salix brachista TaxID=2182728 RepID=A0A5N5MQY6_9ROSI|nr:hypothetical protein DKX38_008321 [Salix brachista]